MAEHSSIPPNLNSKNVKLARFVLENNYVECKLARFVLENDYVECKGIEGRGSFLQRISTAMGASFSVTYAIILMIWRETLM